MNFDDLIDFLDSDDNEFGLSSLATHGFLTASVVAKSLNNWQSLLFEGNEKQVKPAILHAITQWREELQATLQDEQTIELPFDIDDTDYNDIVDSDIGEWAVGFVDAMYASDDEADDWFADSHTEEDVAMLTLPMVLFSGIDEEEADMKQLMDNPATMAQMASAIEKNVVELFLLFHTDD
ncbi:hypothetical protein MOMA_01215 [Moraxella macacae 0408225]|uniref:YecA family protein n=1 Tax=Moraxella macacae 0408225 TaxID=1230338 RepID=L2F884_9GAMM|nr:UPF0149 family protein [Moraxella macacae]ELA08986.1 hypothetical protein MOMA_01215 [Moraxella macacae 0408225]